MTTTQATSYPTVADLRASIRGNFAAVAETPQDISDRSCHCGQVCQNPGDAFFHCPTDVTKYLALTKSAPIPTVPVAAPRNFPSRTSTVTPATEKQILFLTALVNELHPEATDHLATVIASGKERVSQAIAKLVAEKTNRPPVVPEATAPKSEDVLPVWPGRYTVETDDGHRTFEVRRQDSDATFAPGKLILSYLSGSDNTSDYTGFAFIDVDGSLRVWRRFSDNAALLKDAAQFLANPEAALAVAFCGRCHADLTVPESIKLGFGPTCAKKGLR